MSESRLKRRKNEFSPHSTCPLLDCFDLSPFGPLQLVHFWTPSHSTCSLLDSFPFFFAFVQAIDLLGSINLYANLILSAFDESGTKMGGYILEKKPMGIFCAWFVTLVNTIWWWWAQWRIFELWRWWCINVIWKVFADPSTPLCVALQRLSCLPPSMIIG